MSTLTKEQLRNQHAVPIYYGQHFNKALNDEALFVCAYIMDRIPRLEYATIRLQIRGKCRRSTR